MPANATRLLVLGVVQIFGPANGYQLRRELLSWGVESWAHVNPGSIYSMLTTLTKHGLISRHELTDDVRPVTVYQSTPAGTAEMARLVGHALRRLDRGNPTDFRAAMSFASLLPRNDFLTHAGARLDAVERDIVELADVLGPRGDGRDAIPPHVAAEMRLEQALSDAERAWLTTLIADVRAGALLFAEEGGATAWVPPEYDAGWRMIREREQYLAQLSATI